jgi:uncharacterized protein YlxW (UPF0749 family)|tara:strand:+ start:496 stop:660 length:165 start_codon:yes stop_codon:yes gene_type:complete
MDFAAKKEALIKKGTELSNEVTTLQNKMNELNLEIIKINGKIEMCDEELNSDEE